VLLRRLLGDKEFLVTILSTAVASAIFFCAHVVLPQISTGVFGVYLGVIIINICTTVGYRHERKDGERDKRYSTKNNPFIRGLFSGAM
jgi:O-acetyl-ADP-ribose deacetylase (regulator of RNase III)